MNFNKLEIMINESKIRRSEIVKDLRKAGLLKPYLKLPEYKFKEKYQLTMYDPLKYNYNGCSA